MQILRGLGYGKHTIENKTTEEVQVLLQILYSGNEHPIDPERILGMSVSNVICSLLYGHRFDHDDESFQDLIGVNIIVIYIHL